MFPPQLALADPGQTRFIDQVGVDLAGGSPVVAQRVTRPTVIPDACRNDTTGFHDPRHLRQARDRVPHEVDDQLREPGVERGRWQGKRLRGSLDHLETGKPLSERRHERSGRDATDSRSAPAATLY